MRSASTSASRATALLGAFASVSVLTGLLLAGLALPAAWTTGSATRGSVDFFNSLPADLAEPPLSEQSSVLDSTGRPIAYFYDERRTLVPLSRVSPIMQKAIVAIEDSRFFSHGGVDPKGLLRAFVNNQVSNGQVQGASTLTQQYIKLRIFEEATSKGDRAAQDAALAQNYTRKLQEVRMAVSLEKRKTKNEILEGYLNIANFGDSTYGIEAASEYFFGGSQSAKLTLPQAALLAGLVQSPQRYNPFDHPKAATVRRDTVLDRMHELAMISDAEYTAAIAAPLGVKKNPPQNGCITAGDYAYFCAYVRNLITKNAAFNALGATEEERSNTLKRGGLQIRTTLREDIQDIAQAAVKKKVPATDPEQVGAAAVTVEPWSGKVLAMVQNRTYDPADKLGNTVINYNLDRDMGSSTGFQTGSTFKPFVLADWLSKGHGLYDAVDGSRKDYAMSDFTGCQGTLHGEPFTMHNSAESEGSGSMSVIDATAHSVNLAFMDMGSKLSLCDISATATKLGVHLASPASKCYLKKPATTDMPDCLPSMLLGSLELAPLTMASAYAAFAADGTYCSPVVIASITDRDGKQLPVPSTKCSKALDPNVARGVTYALKAVLDHGTAAGHGIGRPAAGKTGTTDNSTETWFVGYTPQLSTAVWVGGNPNPAQKTDSSAGLKNIKIGGQYYSGLVFGATIAAPIWQTIMEKASENLPEKDWPDPTGKVMTGNSISLPDVHGQPVDQALAMLKDQGFDVSVGDQVPSALTPDLAESTSPAAGSRVAAKSKVVIHPGNGQGQPQGGQGNGNGNGNGKTNNGRPGRILNSPGPFPGVFG